jgi:prepilin-type N-terminal cleavage/methylation domain-containing protein
MHAFPRSSAPADRMQSGFTLVEMALVIVIIGLLVGGVTGGQYLVRQSELQSVVTDLNKFRGAWQQFKDQYKGYPGDIIDATDYWGADTASSCTTAPVAGDRVIKTATCNGNGSGTIDTGSNEMFRTWQQMSNAGFIDGAFTGVSDVGSNYDSKPGTNVPAGRITSMTYAMVYVGQYTGVSGWYDGFYNNILLGGAYRSGDLPENPLFTAREMMNLDLKIDDGKPATGILWVHNSGYDPNCTTSDTGASALYKPSSSGPTCSFIYFLP